MDNSHKKINVVIAGRTFPVKVTAEEELTIRNIEKDINSKIQKYQKMYTDKDKLDLALMVLLTQSIELEKVQSLKEDISQAHTQIDTLDYTLDQLL